MKNFRVACDDPVIGLPAAEAPQRSTTHPHNLYLEWLAEAGVPGLLGFLALIAAWSRRLWRASRIEPLDLWLLGPLVAVAVHLWPIGPSASFFSNWFGGIFWLCMGWALAAARLAVQRRAMRGRSARYCAAAARACANVTSSTSATRSPNVTNSSPSPIRNFAIDCMRAWCSSRSTCRVGVATPPRCCGFTCCCADTVR